MRACFARVPVVFTFDRDPRSGQPPSTVLGTATTSNSGKAKLTLRTNGWEIGTYSLTVTYAGNDTGCAGSSATVPITVSAGPGH